MKTSIVVVAVALLLACVVPAMAASDLGDTPITLHATGTPLMDILTVLSEKSGLNIVASTDVETREISIHLTATPIEEALNLIVRASGLGYERIGNSVLVAPQDQLTQDTGFSAYVLEIQYADAFELVPLVEKVAERVAADPGGNRLVVVATPGMIDQIRGIVEDLDVPPLQIMLETEVIEVATDRMVELGIDWNRIMHQTVIFAEPGPGGTPPMDSGYDEVPEIMPFVRRGFSADDVVARNRVPVEEALGVRRHVAISPPPGVRLPGQLGNTPCSRLHHLVADLDAGRVVGEADDLQDAHAALAGFEEKRAGDLPINPFDKDRGSVTGWDRAA